MAIDEGILHELDSDSPVLAIAFGGLAMRIGMVPPFEFFRAMSACAPAKKVFVRDHRQAWYHRGVRGVAGDVEGIEVALRGLIEQVAPAKVVMLGTSAGGYAALLFGRLLGVNEVHAFSPQTFISPELRERYGDRRWPEAWPALIRSGGYQPKYGDLAELFAAQPSQGTRFAIHYCDGDALGTIHAERLAGRSPDVELRCYEDEGPNVVRALRDRGELQQLLSRVLAA